MFSFSLLILEANQLGAFHKLDKGTLSDNSEEQSSRSLEGNQGILIYDRLENTIHSQSHWNTKLHPAVCFGYPF